MSVDPFSVNFQDNGLWQRLYEHVGGDKNLADRWWDTVLPYAPFNLRTPRQLMTSGEWDNVRLFLESQTANSQAPVDYGPSSYYNSKRDGKIPDLQPNRNKYTPRGRRQRRLAGLPEDPLGHE